MKAIVQKRYGSPKVLEAVEVERPQIGDRDVLVRVDAASVHVGDWILMTGKPFVMRMATGIRKPKSLIPGTDVAGTVEAVGKGVERFRAGDEVMGWGAGAFAEYMSASEDQFVPKPTNLSFEQAAAVPEAFITAHDAIVGQAGLAGGEILLILVGLGVIAFGVMQIRKGLREKFMKRMRTRQMTATERDWCARAGKAGYSARGVVFGVKYTLVLPARPGMNGGVYSRRRA